MIDVINRMLLLFILMAAGYIANKTKMLNEEGNRIVSRLVINVTTVATILDSVAGNKIENKSEILVVFILAVFPFVVFPVFSKIAVKLLKVSESRRGAFEAMLVFPNIGFMGIPVISGLYGQEAIFYVSIFMLIFNITFFSYGIAIIGKKSGSNKINFRSMINPGVVSSLMALVVFFFEIKYPVPLAESFEMLGAVTSPLAMMVIGSTIANVPVKEVFKEKKIYIYAAIKLILYPVFTWIVLRNFVPDQTLLGIAVILSGMPTAANVVMACNEYGADSEFVSKGIFFTTLGSMFTIPLLTSLLG